MPLSNFYQGRVLHMVKADPGDRTDLDSTIDHAREAAQRGDWLEAYGCWERVRTSDPEHTAAYLGSADALRRAGRLDDAEELLNLTVARFPDDSAAAIAHARSANARRDWPMALSRWESVRQRFPNNAWGYLGSVQALRSTGQDDQADRLLSLAETAVAADLTRSAASTAKIELEIAKARADWNRVKQVAQKILADEAKTDAGVCLALAQACWHLKERDAADRAAQDALDTNPKLADAILVQAWVATEQGDGERAIGCYRRLIELKPDAVRWRIKLIQLLNWLGRVDEALQELEVANTRWPHDPAVRTVMRTFGPAAGMQPERQATEHGATSSPLEASEVTKLQALADRAPAAARRLRPLLVADPARDVLIVGSDPTEAAVLVFAGSNDAVSMPLSVFDLYLAALPVTAIYLKDFKRLRFLAGISSCGDNYQATVTALRGLLKELNVRRVCTLGNCDGGFAAIRYGIELDADRILAFNAPTHAPRESSLQFEQARNFKRARLAQLGIESLSDLRLFLANRSYRSQIALFFECEDPRDRPHALYLEGLPGVSLHPQPGSSNHHLLREFALSSPDFTAALAGLLDVPCAPVSSS
jgi:tetratricopeptide (TPR) repeat protein